MRVDVPASAKKAGFTLVEALFSLAIVGVLIVCMYSAFSSGFNGVQLEREDARATQILVAKMDQLRLFSWEQITTNGVPSEFVEYFDPTDDGISVGSGGKGKKKGKSKGKKGDALVYKGDIKISKGPNDVTYKDEIKQVEIELEWISANGMKRKRKITTYVARFGLQNYVL